MKTKQNVAKAARMNRAAEAHRILMIGKCPTCGTKLYRNLSLSGWWQCGHVGAAGFQREAGPHCDFQLFYDVTPDEHAAILAAYEKEMKKQVAAERATKLKIDEFAVTVRTETTRDLQWVVNNAASEGFTPEYLEAVRRELARRPEKTTKRVTINDILAEYHEEQYKERGERYATEAEMNMLRADPGMIGWREAESIVADYVQRNMHNVEAIELEVR